MILFVIAFGTLSVLIISYAIADYKSHTELVENINSLGMDIRHTNVRVKSMHLEVLNLSDINNPIRSIQTPRKKEVKAKPKRRAR